MLIIPAVDIMGGKCVRLYQGRAEDGVVYSDDPVLMAKRWQDEGAKYLHVVDLDGAFTGASKNRDAIKKIVDTLSIPVELGGGMRNAESIELALKAGCARVILGTKACDIDFLNGMVRKHGEKIVVGIDARDGLVSVKGWKEVTSITAKDFARKVQDAGIKLIIYTDVARDGALQGPNIGQIQMILDAVDMDIVASGGITTVEDVRALCCLGHKRLTGMIIGKSLYEGRIVLKDAIKAVEECSRKE